MIRYALRCDGGHPFEAWFASSTDFDAQNGRGLVDCPFCGSRTIEKQIMAPAVQGAGRNDPPDPGALQTLMAEATRKARQHIRDTFDPVGDAFAREARAIHEGDSEPRPIWGEATPEETRALEADGVPFSPLPPALTPRRDEDLN